MAGCGGREEGGERRWSDLSGGGGAGAVVYLPGPVAEVCHWKLSGFVSALGRSLMSVRRSRKERQRPSPKVQSMVYFFFGLKYTVIAMIISLLSENQLSLLQG